MNTMIPCRNPSLCGVSSHRIDGTADAACGAKLASALSRPFPARPSAPQSSVAAQHPVLTPVQQGFVDRANRIAPGPYREFSILPDDEDKWESLDSVGITHRDYRNGGMRDEIDAYRQFRGWDSIPVTELDLTGRTVISLQEEGVRPDALREYMLDPDASLSGSTATTDGAVRIEELANGDLYIEDGTHRTAAALVMGRPLRVRLATWDQLNADVNGV